MNCITLTLKDLMKSDNYIQLKSGESYTIDITDGSPPATSDSDEDDSYIIKPPDDNPPLEFTNPEDNQSDQDPSQILLVEFQDKLFRTNSAVVLPEQENPQSTDTSPAGLIASCIRYAQEYPSRKILVAGHTDTQGNLTYNKKLSGWRAQCLASLLTGDGDLFASICCNRERMRTSDYKQILAWLAKTRGWDCNPGIINDSHDDRTQTALNNFRKSYNSDGPGSSWAQKITEWGAADTVETWKAYFNCYEEFIADELGVELGTLNDMRKKLLFYIPKIWVGCNEYHPRVAKNIDEFPCETNRRVEVLFLDSKANPILYCSTSPDSCNKENCELYSDKFPREILPPMVSAKEFTVEWEKTDPPAFKDDKRKCIATLNNAPDGTAVTITIMSNYKGKQSPVVKASASLKNSTAEIENDCWFNPNEKIDQISLSGTEQFSEVTFSIRATVTGRAAVSSKPLSYSDKVDITCYQENGKDVSADRAYTLMSPYGIIKGKTAADGTVKLDKLPPGGVLVELD